MLESGGMVSFWTLCSCKRSRRCRGCYKCMNCGSTSGLLVSSAGVSPARVEMGNLQYIDGLTQASNKAQIDLHFGLALGRLGWPNTSLKLDTETDRATTYDLWRATNSNPQHTRHRALPAGCNGYSERLPF